MFRIVLTVAAVVVGSLAPLTGWAQAYDRQRTAEAGFDAHLVKPVSEFELFQTIAASRSADASADSPAM